MKTYSSKIGQLYQEQLDKCELLRVAIDIYNNVEAFVKFGEKLPIDVRDKYSLKEDDVEFVLKELKNMGCIVEHVDEKLPNSSKCFIVTDFV